MKNIRNFGKNDQKHRKKDQVVIKIVVMLKNCRNHYKNRSKWSKEMEIRQK